MSKCNEKIQRLYNDGVDVNTIAYRLGLSVKSIYRICASVKRPLSKIGCDKCKVKPYANNLCKACYEKQRRRNGSQIYKKVTSSSEDTHYSSKHPWKMRQVWLLDLECGHQEWRYKHRFPDKLPEKVKCRVCSTKMM